MRLDSATVLVEHIPELISMVDLKKCRSVALGLEAHHLFFFAAILTHPETCVAPIFKILRVVLESMRASGPSHRFYCRKTRLALPELAREPDSQYSTFQCKQTCLQVVRLTSLRDALRQLMRRKLS